MTDKESDTGKFFTNYSFEYPKENVVVATSSFQQVPSNKLPLINLTMNGILRPSEEVHEIKMKFDNSEEVPQKDTLARSYGTFVLCQGVYNARKIVKHRWDKETKTLKIFIDLRGEKVRLKRPAQFSFSIQINDDEPCKFKKTPSNISYITACPKRSVPPSVYCCVQTTNCKTSVNGAQLCKGKCTTKFTKCVIHCSGRAC